MGFVPLFFGLWLTSPITWRHLLLVGVWTFGFFFFAVADKWLKYRFKPRYRPALFTYGALSGVCCLVLVATTPHLSWWAILYLPLIAISFHRSWAHRERELASRIVAIAAATLILAVVVNINTTQPWFAGGVTTKAWLFTGLLATYFVSTVPFVKTLIRKRDSQAWIIGSAAVHLLILGTIVYLATIGWVHWFHVAVWVLLATRAIAMPIIAKRRGTPWRPKQVGWTEVVFSLLVFGTLPFGFA